MVSEHVSVDPLLLHCKLSQGVLPDPAVPVGHAQRASSLARHTGEALPPAEVVHCHILKMHSPCAQPLFPFQYWVGCKRKKQQQVGLQMFQSGTLHLLCRLGCEGSVMHITAFSTFVLNNWSVLPCWSRTVLKPVKISGIFNAKCGAQILQGSIVLKCLECEEFLSRYHHREHLHLLNSHSFVGKNFITSRCSCFACKTSVFLFKESSTKRGGGAERRRQSTGQPWSINNPLPGPEMKSARSQWWCSQRSPHIRQTGQIETIWFQQLQTPRKRDNAFHYRYRSVRTEGFDAELFHYLQKRNANQPSACFACQNISFYCCTLKLIRETIVCCFFITSFASYNR